MYTVLAMGGLRAAVGLFAFAFVAACTTTPPVPSASELSARESPPTDCAARIQQADLSNQSSIDSIDPCRFTSEGQQASRQVLAGNPTGDALWAAVWVYASSASDPEPLRPLTRNADPTIAAMAGAALVAFGDSPGFEGVLRAFDSTERMTGSTPPLALDDFALATAATYVIGPGTPPAPEDGGDLTTLKSTWKSWLSANRAALAFNATDGTWSIP